MAVSFIQYPNAMAFAQSPMVYIVSESNSQVLTSSSFQYAMDLLYWDGDVFDSSSAQQYTLLKYPNAAGVGQFDVSRIMSSLFTELRAANSSSYYYYNTRAYTQYKNNPTGSFVTSSRVYGPIMGCFDGYQIFQDDLQVYPQVYQTITSPYWPIMTDGPQSQSFHSGDLGRLGVRMIPLDPYTPTHAIYQNNDTLGQVVYNLTAWDGNTNTVIDTIPLTPGEPDFPLTGSVTDYSFAIFTSSIQLSGLMRLEETCEKKYPPVRIMWKNRYGQFDYFNFDLVSRESFNTERSRYQPQIGSWDSRLLNYSDYESSLQNYIVDSTLKLSVNSDYVDEAYNDIFKQLMVSDEIYWLYDQANNKVKPLTLDTTTFNIKTSVVDKLIQYSFDFTQGQGYKLIF